MRRITTAVVVTLLLVASVVTAYQADVDVLSIATGNSTLYEENLATYTLLPSKLTQNGQVVRVTVWGTTANNTRNGKVVRLYFGASSFDISTGAIDGQGWRATLECVRISATSQRCAGVTATGALSGSGTTILTPTEDLTTSITIRLTGTNGLPSGSGDVTKSGFIVEYLN